jgi:hypothetical protein
MEFGTDLMPIRAQGGFRATGPIEIGMAVGLRPCGLDGSHESTATCRSSNIISKRYMWKMLDNQRNSEIAAGAGIAHGLEIFESVPLIESRCKTLKNTFEQGPSILSRRDRTDLVTLRTFMRWIQLLVI